MQDAIYAFSLQKAVAIYAHRQGRAPWNLLLQKWPGSKAFVHYHALQLDREVLTWDWGSHKADDLGFPGQGEAVGAPEQPHRHPP